MRTYAQPKLRTPTESSAAPVQQAAVPNSARLGMLGVEDSAETLGELQARFERNQIPVAEREADEIASGIGAETAGGVKEELGERMGADFSPVRFHTDPASAETATTMGARAYTEGNDVYFGAGGFDPGVAAHELVHTVQQGGVDSSMATESAPAGNVQMNPFKKIGSAIASGFTRVKNAITSIPQRIRDSRARRANQAQQQGVQNQVDQMEAEKTQQATQLGPLYDPRISGGRVPGQFDLERMKGLVSQNYQHIEAPRLSLEEQAPIVDRAEQGLAERHLRHQRANAMSELYFDAPLYQQDEGGVRRSGVTANARRIEALYDTEGGDNDYNRELFEVMRTLDQRSSARGQALPGSPEADINQDAALNDPEFMAKASRVFSPHIQRAMTMSSDAAENRQMGASDFFGTKKLSGQFHAVSDMVPSMPRALQEQLFGQYNTRDQTTGETVPGSGIRAFKNKDLTLSTAWMQGHKDLGAQFGLQGTSFQNVMGTPGTFQGRFNAHEYSDLDLAGITEGVTTEDQFDPTSPRFTGGQEQVTRAQQLRGRAQAYRRTHGIG